MGQILTLKGGILSFPHLLERNAMKEGSAAKYSTGIYVDKKTPSGVALAQIFATYPAAYRGSVNSQFSPIKDGDKKFMKDGELTEDIVGKGMWRLNPSARCLKGAKESDSIPLYVRATDGKVLKLDRIRDKEQIQKLEFGGANADVKISFYEAKGSPGAELLGVCFNGFGEPLGSFSPPALGTEEDFAGQSDVITQISPEVMKQLQAQKPNSEEVQNSKGMQDLDDEVPF